MIPIPWHPELQPGSDSPRSCVGQEPLHPFSSPVTSARALPQQHVENVALFQETKCRSFSLTGNEKFLLGSSCASRREEKRPGGGKRWKRKSKPHTQSSEPCTPLPVHPHTDPSVSCSPNLVGDHSWSSLDLGVTPKNLSAHGTPTWGLPGTLSPAQGAGRGEQEGQCLPREQDKEEQPCTVHITSKRRI